jgi:hypothetical protein
MQVMALLYGRSGLPDVLPPTANVIISNVPGPPMALYAAGAHPIAAAVVSRRTSELTELEAEGRDPIPLIAGITLNLPTYEPVDCPLCAAGEPIVTPGSSGR